MPAKMNISIGSLYLLRSSSRFRINSICKPQFIVERQFQICTFRDLNPLQLSLNKPILATTELNTSGECGPATNNNRKIFELISVQNISLQYFWILKLNIWINVKTEIKQTKTILTCHTRWKGKHFYNLIFQFRFTEYIFNKCFIREKYP